MIIYLNNICSRSHWLTQVTRCWRCWGCRFYFLPNTWNRKLGRKLHLFGFFCASVLRTNDGRGSSRSHETMCERHRFHSHGSSFLWWRPPPSIFPYALNIPKPCELSKPESAKCVFCGTVFETASEWKKPWKVSLDSSWVSDLPSFVLAPETISVK